MQNTMTSTRKLYFYPPSKAALPPTTKPGQKPGVGDNQLYRSSGPVPKHQFSPEPWPPKRFHQGSPSDMFVLKGGTKNYSEQPKVVDDVPQKDIATFYGQTQDSYKAVGEKQKYGDSVMKFYGHGQLLEEKKERMKETVTEARTKFNFMNPDAPTKLSFGTLARKTLKDEMKDFNKVTMSYKEAYEAIHGEEPRLASQNGETNRINLFTGK